MDRLLAGLSEVPALHVVARPDSTLVALQTDGSCDVFTLADELRAAGWFVQPQMTFEGRPPTLHLTLSAATAPHVEDFLAVLEDAVETAVATGPVEVDPEVADLVRALDPATLSDADFDGLLDAAGLTGGAGNELTLPERMAEVNALLDLASPALREAVLTAFLDRLSRPTPG
jgi:sphinganine-1-phosphate aldolase